MFREANLITEGYLSDFRIKELALSTTEVLRLAR